MTKAISSLSGLLMVVLATQCYSQTLHVISVANTNDPTLGAGFEANANMIRDYASLASSVSGLSLDMKEVIGADYTCQSIRESVAKLGSEPSHKIGPSDVILFYHSGHGVSPAESQASASQSKYPSFECEKNAATPENVALLPNLEKISEALRSKGARLTIVVADSCNRVLSGPFKVYAKKGAEPSRIKAMIQDFKGSILMSSSVRGQRSWYTSDGGLFTGRLIDTLRAPESSTPDDLWKDSIEEITADIVLPPGVEETHQKPQAVVDLVYAPK